MKFKALSVEKAAKTAKVALAATVLSMCSMVNLAQAGIIDTSNDSFIDDNSNLEWLDFNITSNQSYNSVVENLDSGEIYDGWRLATMDEVTSLYSNAFFDLADSWREYPDNDVPSILAKANNNKNINGIYGDSNFEQVFDAMGASNYATGDGYDTTHALYEDSGGNLAYFQLIDRKTADNVDIARLYWGFGTITDNYRTTGGTSRSTMLVRGASEVPEPSSLAIFALGIIGLAFRTNKQLRM